MPAESYPGWSLLPPPVHGPPPNDPAIALSEAIAKLRNPQRIPSHTKPAQQVTVLIARIGQRQRRQGESRKARIDDGRHRKSCPGDGVPIPPVQHHPPIADPVCFTALQPPKLPRHQQPNIHERRRAIDQITPEIPRRDRCRQHQRDIRRATHKHHYADDKIRVVLEGLPDEESIAALCRHEAMAESLYYAWSKEFLEAGKRRLAGDGGAAWRDFDQDVWLVSKCASHRCC
jgi:transposase